MGWATKFVLIALLTFTLIAGAQTASALLSREPAGTIPTAETVNPAPQGALIRILTPAANQQLPNNSATVRFQLTTPAATLGAPNFLVQLDGRTPVETSLAQQVFTNLKPGPHTVTVELVDANGTPIRGRHAAVEFFVPATKGGDSNLPPASSPLPLISIIGFGVLVGGIVSAMKTRS